MDGLGLLRRLEVLDENHAQHTSLVDLQMHCLGQILRRLEASHKKQEKIWMKMEGAEEELLPYAPYDDREREILDWGQPPQQPQQLQQPQHPEQPQSSRATAREDEDPADHMQEDDA